MANSVWELAHGDGTSIFVRHTANGPETVPANGDEDVEEGVTFGPFLYADYSKLAQLQGSVGGPLNLLATVGRKTFRAQQISVDWVIDLAEVKFGAVQTDCVVLDEVLFPLTLKGARVADDYDKNRTTSWTELGEELGEDMLHSLVIDMMNDLLDPQGEAH